jgi:DNA-binding transcriptional LysR family regulator
MVLPARPHQSFDRGALSVSAAVDDLDVALETTRFAEREFAQGELIEVGPKVFKKTERVMHFFSQRTNEQQVEKVRSFREWLLAQVRRQRRPA